MTEASELVWYPNPENVDNGHALWFGQEHILPVTDNDDAKLSQYFIGTYDRAYYSTFAPKTATNRIFIGNSSGTPGNTSLAGTGVRSAVLYTDTTGTTPKLKLGYSDTNWATSNTEFTVNTYGELVDTKGDYTIEGATTFSANVTLNNLVPQSDGNIEVFGNLNVQGNLNYVNVEDLLVN